MSETTLLRIIDYGPYTQSDQAPGDPSGTTPPALSQMEAQVDFIANNDVANTLRIYTLDDQQSSLINYAIGDGLNVIPSVDLPNPNPSSSDRTPATWSAIMSDPAVMSELNLLISTLESLPASDLSKIPFVDIGNEEISQVGGWSDTDLEDAIEYVKQSLPASIVSQLQFTTAETYDGQYINLQNGSGGVDYSYDPSHVQDYIATNLGNSPDVNVIFVNIHPYWDGILVANAASYVDQIYQTLEAIYPNKQIVISETGWPSSGTPQYSGVFTNPQQSSVPSLANEQTFWQDFLPIANEQNISFGAFEAFDEPNKETPVSEAPGSAAEDNWGLIVTNSGPDYTSSTFKTAVTSLMPTSPPAYPENPGNNDEWILSDGNWAASAGPGSHPSGYNVAGIGDWTGGGTDGILWFNPSTGDTDEWQLSNTQWATSVDLGSHPGNYQISGIADFFGNGIDDVLWTGASGDDVQTDIWQLNSNGKWENSTSPGSHPAGYSVAGVGDWTGNGTDGILWYDSTTGDTDEWQLNDGQWSASVDLGTHPGIYQISGIGDFFDNGRDDVLWTSVNSNGTVSTDIWELGSNGQWIASVSPGSHPAGYQVVGVGDFTGAGTSGILWQNPTTGDVDEWLINNGKWAGSVDLGIHPGSFQIVGVGDFTGTGTNDVFWHANI